MKKTMILGLMATVLATVACTKTIEPTPATNDNMTITVRLNDGASKASFTDDNGTWKFAFTTGDVLKVWNSEVEFANAYTYTCESVSADAATFTCATEVPQTAAAATWYAAFGLADTASQSGAFDAIANRYVLYGKLENIASDATSLAFTLDPKVSIINLTNINDELGFFVKIKENNVEKYWDGKVSIVNNEISFGQTDTKTVLCTGCGESVKHFVVPAGKEVFIMGVDSANYDTYIQTSKSAGLTAGRYYGLKVGWKVRVVKCNGNRDYDVNMFEREEGIWTSNLIEFTINGSDNAQRDQFKLHLKSTWYGSGQGYWLNDSSTDIYAWNEDKGNIIVGNISNNWRRVKYNTKTSLITFTE